MKLNFISHILIIWLSLRGGGEYKSVSLHKGGAVL